MKSCFFFKYLAAKVIGMTILFATGVALAQKFEQYHMEDEK